MLNYKKLLAILTTIVLFAGYDLIYLERIEDIRYFNLVAELLFALMAAILFLSIDELKGKNFYYYLKYGFFLAFLSMLIDGLDQLHYHGEIYTAIWEKFTLMVAFTFIIIGVKNWIVDFSRLNSILEKKVITDQLTGLYNRRGMLQQFETMENLAKEKGLSLSFIIADLDDFKVYNDTMGHLAGDELLSELGASLLKLMDSGQVIGRWGGEEFAISLLGCDLEQAQSFAEKIRNSVLDVKLPEKMGGKIQSLSLGVAELKHNETSMETIKRADKSLYQAKRNGKNQVCAINE